MKQLAMVLAAGLPILGAGAALADSGCSPGSFQNVDFRKMSSLTSYAFLSNLSESDFQQNQTQIKTGMVIPYINVPAHGDYQSLKSQLHQVERMTQMNLTQSYRETLLNIGWSELGLEAYKACLNAQSDETIVVEPLKGNDPFGSDLILSVTLLRKTAASPFPIEQIICAGCETYSGLKADDPIAQGKQYLFQLTRRANTNLSVVVKIDGRLGEFYLPKPVIPPITAIRRMTLTVSATNRELDHLIPTHTVYCLPTDDRNNPKLNPGEEFIVGTASGQLIGRGGPSGDAQKPVMTSDNEHEVCWKLDVRSNDIHNGYDGTYALSAETVAPGK